MVDVSIVVPVYKVERYLRQCVNSILAQTYSNFKLVLVDDGSPDNCGLICDEYASADRRVHVIHRANGGLSAARNSGIDWVAENLNSEWILFVDGDDALVPNALEMLRRAAINHHVEIVVSSFQRADNLDNLMPINNARFDVVSPHDFWKEGRIQRVVAWGKLFHVNLFKDIRFPVGKINEDEFTTPFVLFKVDEIAVTACSFYRYLKRGDSIMGVKWSVERLACIEAKKVQEEFFNMKGLQDLAWDAFARRLNCMGGCLAGMRNAENKIEFADRYQMLRADLREELKKCKIEHPFPIGGNFQCYNGLYPLLVNQFTWPLFRVAFYIEHVGIWKTVAYALRSIINHNASRGKVA